MKIGVIGTGYVGLVTGVCLADFGFDVVCMDIDEKKIQALRQGICPIYEEGLEDLIVKNSASKRLTFTTDIRETVTSSDALFIAVGTPAQENGSADLTHVLEAARSIGTYLDHYTVIVNKSTVPVGTGVMVRSVILEELKKGNRDIPFDVVSNPEFLREGKAVYDFTHPDRIVIGTDSERPRELMKEIYRVLTRNETPILFCSIESAEMIKYASNAFLAVKISFINEMALLAEKVGANITDIAHAMGLDSRISPHFLNAGPGYGGSCFPKDLRAVTEIARRFHEELFVIEAAICANEKQKAKMVEKITDSLGDLTGKTITILGLTFKPDTDDMRDAPSLTIVPELIKRGAVIRAFCPQGNKEALWRFADIKSAITYCLNEYEAAERSDAIVLLTEWNQFCGMNLEKLKTCMTGSYFFDLRNVYATDPEIRELFDYQGVGI